MPKPAHDRVTFRGVFGSVAAPLEQWSFSLGLTPDPLVANFTGPQMTSLAEGLGDIWNARIAPLMDSSIKLTETRWARITEDGETDTRPDGTYRQGVKPQVGVGGANPQVTMPLQVALACSLNTPRAGATGKGRIFLPFPFWALESDRRLTAGQAGTVANHVAGLINDLNSMGAGIVSVFSSKGYSSPVTQVRVGRTPDTIRSRRGDSPEGYVFNDTAIVL